MPSITQGGESTSSDPILDVDLGFDVEVLEYRVLDVSTPLKRLSPVQTFPLVDGEFEALDPSQGPPDGHRLALGHFFAPYEAPTDEPVGDHVVEWRYKVLETDPGYDSTSEEFYVVQGSGFSLGAEAYCSVQDIRDEGYLEATYSDERVILAIEWATEYIQGMTGRWFYPRIFDEDNPFLMDGNGSRALHLEIPVIRLDKVEIDSEEVEGESLSEIALGALVVYNRHMTGMTQPDDRANPRIAFKGQSRFGATRRLTAYGVYGFPRGRQNVRLQGAFGYTDPDGSPLGRTPKLIRLCAVRLAIRELRGEADACEKNADKNKWRIQADREGSTSVTLQPLWLKGPYTGNPEIDQILTRYRRPARIATTGG